jgi:hypothetical protein
LDKVVGEQWFLSLLLLLTRFHLFFFLLVQQFGEKRLLIRSELGRQFGLKRRDEEI